MFGKGWKTSNSMNEFCVGGAHFFVVGRVEGIATPVARNDGAVEGIATPAARNDGEGKKKSYKKIFSKKLKILFKVGNYRLHIIENN